MQAAPGAYLGNQPHHLLYWYIVPGCSVGFLVCLFVQLSANQSCCILVPYIEAVLICTGVLGIVSFWLKCIFCANKENIHFTSQTLKFYLCNCILVFFICQMKIYREAFFTTINWYKQDRGRGRRKALCIIASGPAQGFSLLKDSRIYFLYIFSIY